MTRYHALVAPRFCIALVFSCLLSMQFAIAQSTIHVPADQPTIQAAITAAQTGDTVLVAPGTYFENINFLGKAITVTSSDGPAVTTIDGGNLDSVVKFTSGESNGAVIKGFTITHGKSMFNAGGIQVSNSAPTIDGDIITNNQTCDSGAGLQIAFSSAIVRNNTITNNFRAGCTGGVGGGGISIRGAASAQILNNLIANNSIPGTADGGGISLFAAGTPTISGNTISGNTSSEDGGGIAMVNQSDANIFNNLITGNSASGNGGGVYFLVPSGARGPFLVNNTVVNNTAASGSGVFADGFDAAAQLVNNVFFNSNASPVACGNGFGNSNGILPVISSNDVFSPVAFGFSGFCSNLNGSPGNISADPQFVNLTGNNFHMQASSPAIDAGNNNAPNLPQQDLDGNPRIAFGSAATCTSTVDMGAYEFVLTSTPSASLSPASLDFSTIAVGTSSNQQTLTLAATQGCVAKPTIAASGDYHETDNCSFVLATGASCIIQVTFSPTAGGTRNGTLTANAGSINLSSSLTGQGGIAAATLSPSSLDFGSQPLATTSAAHIVTLTSAGTFALQVSGINISGNFAQSNNCPASLAPGASCSIAVTFTPAATGVRTGTLVVSSNGGALSSSLSGIGADYTVSASPSTISLKNGQTASLTITVTALGGSFNSPVTLICSGLPTGAACSFSPSSVTPGATSASSALAITTTSEGNRKTPRGTFNITVQASSSGLVHSTVIALTVR